MAQPDSLTLETLSRPMRLALEALLDDAPPPADALAALTDEERAELASLARTANLTSLTLHQPDPNPDAQANAWAQAEKALDRRAAAPSPPPAAPPPKPRRNWLDRLLKREE